ncbi:hypothetical protein EL06_28360, partial [Salmonella enterica subsp. diarizonae]|nr:hypothetical protein [Salmonella enterica subsp. diarizonae]
KSPLPGLLTVGCLQVVLLSLRVSLFRRAFLRRLMEMAILLNLRYRLNPLCLTLNRQILILSPLLRVAAPVVVRNLTYQPFFLKFHLLMQDIYTVPLYFIMTPVLHGILMLLWLRLI